MEKRTFNKGDFVKYCVNNNGTKVTFGIFEGIDLEPSYQYTKKYSLLLYYDSRKYCNQSTNGNDWGYKPSLEVSLNGKPCEKSIDTLEEDTWWSLCTPEEKENAIHVLHSYGYEWDEELMSLIDIKTGEIVRKIIIPKIEYNGEIIKPITQTLKDKLKKVVKKKNTTSVYGYYPPCQSVHYGHGYDGYYDDWD